MGINTMKVKIEMEININHPAAKKATKKQVKEWVEFNLGDRKELNRSPIDNFDTTFDFRPKLTRIIEINR